jgi:hypothetical protein
MRDILCSCTGEQDGEIQQQRDINKMEKTERSRNKEISKVERSRNKEIKGSKAQKRE